MCSTIAHRNLSEQDLANNNHVTHLRVKYIEDRHRVLSSEQTKPSQLPAPKDGNEVHSSTKEPFDFYEKIFEIEAVLGGPSHGLKPGQHIAIRQHGWARYLASHKRGIHRSFVLPVLQRKPLDDPKQIRRIFIWKQKGPDADYFEFAAVGAWSFSEKYP